MHLHGFRNRAPRGQVFPPGQRHRAQPPAGATSWRRQRCRRL